MIRKKPQKFKAPSYLKLKYDFDFFALKLDSLKQFTIMFYDFNLNDKLNNLFLIFLKLRKMTDFFHKTAIRFYPQDFIEAALMLR